MKNINIGFTDREFRKLNKVKELSKFSWKDFILFLLEKSNEENKSK